MRSGLDGYSELDKFPQNLLKPATYLAIIQQNTVSACSGQLQTEWRVEQKKYTQRRKGTRTKERRVKARALERRRHSPRS